MIYAGDNLSGSSTISASGVTKRWDIQNYIKLAQELKKKHKC